ncbi:MAG: efflux RND transporter periplasmic adaptor subunit [Verrucomicrobiales bacterium]|nr:efflux RND transporter periplasmic adaptor subunit [Verrucomicrobiales bacterium]
MNPSTPKTLASPNSPTKPNKRASRRWISWLAIGVFIALLVAGLWPRPTPVEVVSVGSGPLRVTVNEEGKTRIKQRYVISAPVTGHLRRIPLKAGDALDGTNTLIAVIDPLAPGLLDARSRSLYEARRDSAIASLERARAQHLYATNELRRLDRLFREKTLSIQDLEAAQWREMSAQKERSAAEAALREAEAALKDFGTVQAGGSSGAAEPTEVRAGTQGRVLRVFEESTRVVTAGTPLVEVGDPQDLEAVIEVLSRDGAAIAPGTRVELEQWGAGEPLEAKVRLVEPSAFTKVSALGVEEQRVNVVADILTPPEKRKSLGDAYRIEGKIVMWEIDRTVKVPTGALFRQGADWAVLTFAEGFARLRKVQIGRSSGSEAQVLSGLQEGERLILYPGDRIRDGQRVKVMSI